MLRGIPSIIMGALGLALLEAVVSTQQGSSNVGGLIAGAAKLVNDFISPQVPAFNVQASATAAAGPASAPTTVLVSTSAPQPAPPALTPGGIAQPPVGPVLVPNAPVGSGAVTLA